ncbi:helix-turn-helix domain-containing protein [Kitasatospora sp. NPDC088391]|uniref:helix-turn-helix domain-containing protein n=1 Tax=Kitasatospora sp. NPDC088391 TaxID=3364074 RepID=UPI003811365B
MPRSSNDKNPLSYIRSGTWPHVQLASDAPVSAYCGLVLARDLATMMTTTGHSLRTLGERAGVAHSTIARILGGEVLPDIGTLARLEDALDHQLWPGPKALRAEAAQHGRTTT